MQRISSVKGVLLRFPRPRNEAERLAREAQKRRNEAILLTIVNRRDEK